MVLLETIWICVSVGLAVIDIASELNYLLSASDGASWENVHIQLYGGGMTLNRREKIAETTYERHTILSDMLITLGVDQKTAVEDACRIEHVDQL